MAMRLSGLISGMDTDTVVAQLMNAHRLKSTKVQNKITTTEWKQEKWKALNSKIYSLYTGSLSKLRMQGSFAVKKAASSNESKVEVSAGANAPEGTHLIKVKQLASSQFLTGAKLGENGDGKDNNGDTIALSTKLVDLGFSAEEGTSIHIKAGNKEVNLDVRANTTIGEFVNKLKEAGLNANFDIAQNRLFISSKTSGKESAFSITTSSTSLVNEKNEIRDFVNYDSLSSSDKNKLDGYLNEYLNDVLVETDRKVLEGKIFEFKYNEIKAGYIDGYMANQGNIDRVTVAVEKELRTELELEPDDTLDQELLDARVKDKLIQEAEMKAFEELEAYEAWASGEDIEIQADNVYKVAAEELSPLMVNYKVVAENPETIDQSGKLSALGLGEITVNEDGSSSISGASAGSVLVQATDAIVIYNGAELTGSSNNFSVNGLTLTLKSVTAGLDTVEAEDDETISLSVSGNTEAVYDMVKDFIKTYNELLKEMNDAYNADSARGFDPPSDDDKRAMTDDQIEKVEGRIKDSLLRRDNTLGGLINVLRSTLNEGVTVDGKTYALSSFGITTGSYTEKGILHINGDEDFNAASSENKLMAALTDNPDEVMQVLSKLGDNLYNSLMDKMKSTTLSSALTVYNDKEISKTLTNYKSDLAKMESKLLDIENRYFKQFAAMESAMARMNSQSSALMSMLGMGNQN